MSDKATEFLAGLPAQGVKTITLDFAASEAALAEIDGIYRELQEPVENLAVMIGQREAEVFVFDLVGRIVALRKAFPSNLGATPR